MSQNDMSQQFNRWSPEHFQEKLSDTLASLLIPMEDRSSYVDKSEELKGLFQMCIPRIAVEDLEKNLFQQLMPKLELTFSSLLTEIRTKVTNAGVDVNSAEAMIADNLQLPCAILDCLEFCLSYLSSENHIVPEHIYSLPPSALNIVQESYAHCKESPIIYGDLLEASNEALTELFQKTGSVLTILISITEKLIISSQIAEDIICITTILDSLRNISQVVYELDVKIMASLWKTYIRIAVQYVDDIKDQLDVGSAIRVLGHQITKDLESIMSRTASGCVGSDIEKYVLKLLRISGFNMKILVMLCDKYAGYLGDCSKDIVELIFTLYRNFPPSCLAPTLSQTLFDEMERQLIIGIDPLITHLSSDREFASCLTSTAEVLSEKEPYFFSLLLTFILEKIPRLNDADYDMWIVRNHMRTSIYDKLFQSLPACHVNLMMPVYHSGVMCQGKPQRKVSLYEHICTRFCGFVACFPARHFPLLERTLLQNLLCPFYWRQLLASDVWAFLARVGSAELCWNHCCLLAELIKKCDGVHNSSSIFLVNLLNRLIHFLAVEHVEQFILKYSVKEFPMIWESIAITRRSCPSLQKQAQNAATNGLASLQDLLNVPTKGNFSDLRYSISLINCGIRAAHILKKEDSLSNNIQEACMKLWKTVLFHDSSIVRHTIPIVLKIILLTARLLPHLDCVTSLEILTFMQLLTQTKDDAINIGIVACLQQLRKKFFPSSAEQMHILDLLSDIFAEVLQDTNWLVLTLAMEAFSLFAHETNHTEVIPMCFKMRPHLQELISKYLSKVPIDCGVSTGGLAEFLNEEQGILLMDQCQTSMDDLQRPAKRLRSDENFVINENDEVSCHQVAIDDCLSAMRSSVAKLKDLAMVHGLSTASFQQLEQIHFEISELCDV